MKINCEYDKKSKCNTCKHKQVCTLTVKMTDELYKIQTRIIELTDEIEKIKKDIEEWKKLNRQIKSGLYHTKKNIRGEWITKPSHIINIPDLGFLEEELEEKTNELLLYQNREIELIKNDGAN